MNLLELIVLCASIFISFAGSPSYISNSSIIDETFLQSISLSGPVLVEILDQRSDCKTCYVLLTQEPITTRKCNPHNKPIWELWYKTGSFQRGGYCIEFESVDIEQFYLSITSVIASSIPNTGSDSGSITIYEWNKGHEMTLRNGTFSNCVPCYDFLYLYSKLSPFECNPGNNLKVKVNYEISMGMEETGYCAGQINMTDRELRNIKELFWFDKIEVPRCEDCLDVLTFGANASKDYCDNEDKRIWHVQYYKHNWNLAIDGYCMNIMVNPVDLWDIIDNKHILYAQMYRLDLSEYHYFMGYNATDEEKSTCKPCAKLIYEHQNMIEDCKSNGQTLWQVWFNTTNGESYAGFCIDFLEFDLRLIAENYITYILASNESSTYEWLRSTSELQKVTEIYPPCVNCRDLINEETYLSTFYCDPGNQHKVKVDFTTITNQQIRGYCAGFHHDYNIGKIQYNVADVEMYDTFSTYLWNVRNETMLIKVPFKEKCVDCYDVFVTGLNVSDRNCDSGNRPIWRVYYEMQAYDIANVSKFDGYCINFDSDSFNNWNVSEDIAFAQARLPNFVESYYYVREYCSSCYDVVAYGSSLSTKSCKSWGEELWKFSFTESNYEHNGYCINFHNLDYLNDWYAGSIRDNIQNIHAENGMETFDWQRPSLSSMECVSC